MADVFDITMDPVAYNRILWRELKGDVKYPGDDTLAETRLRHREALKTAWSAGG